MAKETWCCWKRRSAGVKLGEKWCNLLVKTWKFGSRQRFGEWGCTDSKKISHDPQLVQVMSLFRYVSKIWEWDWKKAAEKWATQSSRKMFLKENCSFFSGNPFACSIHIDLDIYLYICKVRYIILFILLGILSLNLHSLAMFQTRYVPSGKLT